jgi:hypothetical protein
VATAISAIVRRMTIEPQPVRKSSCLFTSDGCSIKSLRLIFSPKSTLLYFMFPYVSVVFEPFSPLYIHAELIITHGVALRDGELKVKRREYLATRNIVWYVRTCQTYVATRNIVWYVRTSSANHWFIRNVRPSSVWSCVAVVLWTVTSSRYVFCEVRTMKTLSTVRWSAR